MKSLLNKETIDEVVKKISHKIKERLNGCGSKTNRKDVVTEIIKEVTKEYENLSFAYYFPEYEKPCRGANGSVIHLSKRYRIQYRCGYGKYNYAPCLEVYKLDK